MKCSEKGSAVKKAALPLRVSRRSYAREMGIVPGGSLALLASVGPLGIGAIDHAIQADRRPSRVEVGDHDEARLKELNGGKLYDDVFAFAPVRPVVEMTDRLLGGDGCLNLFAGPADPEFSASINLYKVHYESHHLVGTSGGNTDEMKESLAMMASGRLNPVAMITHVGGLNAAAKFIAPDSVTLDKGTLSR